MAKDPKFAKAIKKSRDNMTIMGLLKGKLYKGKRYFISDILEYPKADHYIEVIYLGKYKNGETKEKYLRFYDPRLDLNREYIITEIRILPKL